MTRDTYGIRPDYQPNVADRTRETGATKYWTPRRLALSRLFQRAVYTWARELVERHKIASVLDVGCGPGTKSLELLAPICDLYGVDQPSAIELARSTGIGHFEADDLISPSFPFKGQFDMVICSDVIEHVPDPDSVLGYIRHYVTARGLVLISTPDRTRWRGAGCLYSPKAEHIREWSGDEFVSYLASRGFHVIERRYSPPLAFSVRFAHYFLLHALQQLQARRSLYFNHAVLCRAS